MNLMDTARAFLDQCLLVALDSFLAEFAFNHVGAIAQSRYSTESFWAGNSSRLQLKSNPTRPPFCPIPTYIVTVSQNSQVPQGTVTRNLIDAANKI